MKIAGRYMGDIARKGAMNPYISAAGLGGLTAGAATLGNIVSGEAADEGAGRLGLEALGAGALGAYVGSRTRTLIPTTAVPMMAPKAAHFCAGMPRLPLLPTTWLRPP
jgi:hypothetical protein